ncbi:hypothetical protein DIPPA_32936, partial [Diplonema papillatum]
MRPAVLALLAAAAAAGVGGQSTCNDMFCNCTASRVDNPNLALIYNMLSYAESPRGLPLDYLAPRGYWATAGDELGEQARLEQAYGIRTQTLGLQMVALAVGKQTAAADAVSGVMLLKTPGVTLTENRGNGAGWLYGEDSQVVGENCGDQCLEGYLVDTVSDAAAWPDPLEVSREECTWGECDTVTYTSTKGPNLRSTAWAGLIGPLQADWIRFVLISGRAVPSSANSFAYVSAVVGAVMASEASVGGFYEAPVRNPGDPLVIDVASNILLLVGASMAQQVVSSGIVPTITSACRAFIFDARNDQGGWHAWDPDASAVRTSLTIQNPSTNATTIEYSNTWAIETQFIALAVLGEGLDRMYANAPGAAHRLWIQCRETFGVYREVDGKQSLAGFGNEANGQISTETTFLAVLAGYKLVREYYFNTSIVSSVSDDLRSLRAVGLLGFACNATANTTSMENATSSATPKRFGYLSSASPGSIDGPPATSPPFIGTASSAWAAVVSAANDPVSQFSPFQFPKNLPGTTPSPALKRTLHRTKLLPELPSGCHCKTWGLARNWGFSSSCLCPLQNPSSGTCQGPKPHPASACW